MVIELLSKTADDIAGKAEKAYSKEAHVLIAKSFTVNENDKIKM